MPAATLWSAKTAADSCIRHNVGCQSGGKGAYDECMQNTLAVVSLTDIVRNAHALRTFAGVPLIAVVKDDAYGHGAVAVAHALRGAAQMFAVATVDEGAELVSAGVGENILVLTPPLCRQDAARAAAYGLVQTLSSVRSLRFMLRAGLPVRAHIAVNTGMNRYGFAPYEVAAACRAAKEGGISVEGVFSHYYAPDDVAARCAQTRAFCAACEDVCAVFPSAMRHLSATGGLAAGGDRCDAVRAGLGLYGYLPEKCRGVRLRPAMKVYATVVQSGVPYGGGAGYARAPRRFRALHTLRLGYGDGFFRAGAPWAVGALCMDACVCEGEAPVGRRVCVMDDARIYAERHGTSPYEVLVRVGRGAEKRYV